MSNPYAALPWYRNWLIWLLLSPFMCCFGFMLLHFVVYAPQAGNAQAELETEFSLIAPLPQATEQSYSASHKTDRALVSATYLATLSYDEIRAYYDGELERNGWQLFGERIIRDQGRDLGGRGVTYCKGKYSASIQYAGEQANYGWTYDLALSWRLSGDCIADSAGGWIKYPVPDSLFLLVWSLFFAFGTGFGAWISWVKPHLLLHPRRRTPLRGVEILWHPIPQSIKIWYFRIALTLGFVMGVGGIVIAAHSLWRHIFER